MQLAPFWRALEVVPGLAAVRAEWSHWLGPELAWVEPRLLRPTGDIAAVFPCADSTPYHVIDHGNGRYRAVHPDGRTSLDLSRDDLIVRRLDVQTLAAMLAPALGFDVERFVGRVASGVLQIGKWRATAKTTCAVSLCIRPDPTLLQDAVRRAIAEHDGPQVVLVPGMLGDDDLVRLTQERSACLLSLSEAIAPGAGGDFVMTPVAERLLDRFQRSLHAAESVAAGDEPNLFRRTGDVWELRFDGGQRFPVAHREARGLAYLHLVLQRPRIPHSVLELDRVVAGATHTPQSGSSGEMLDDEARRAFRDQYRAIEDELAEAVELGDVVRQEHLTEAREALAAELKAATGLGGRSRIHGEDTERVRKKVTVAIGRAITAVEKRDAALAHHLRTNVTTGRQITYIAEPCPDWAT